MAKSTVAKQGKAGEVPALKRVIHAAKCVEGKPRTVKHIERGAASA